MRKQIFRILIMLLLVCVTLQPLSVCATEWVDVSRKCSLELDYSTYGDGFSGLDIRIYRIAELYSDGAYALIAPFTQLPVKIHNITSQKEWRDAANSLAAYITAQQIAPTARILTDASGKANFRDLQTGVYLVLGVTAEKENAIYKFENFCVFLPRPLTDGTYQYDYAAKPKSSMTPKPEQPEEIQFQVVKLWKDTGVRNLRPKSITVAIFKNGILQEEVSLDSGNNWSYSWSAPAGNDVWTVVETDVPDDYTVVITENGHVFTITNSRPAPQGQPPKTGDIFALNTWLVTMSVSGILLIVCGLLQKRRSR